MPCQGPKWRNPAALMGSDPEIHRGTRVQRMPERLDEAALA